MKKILVINGHPNKESFSSGIAQCYIDSAILLSCEIRYIVIGELDFNPNLQFGYKKRMELEPDLLKALEDIQWSDHQVWIHPIWWLSMPAIMKGFFDRAFLPGITFKSNKGGISEGLLKGKTARIITTAGDISIKTYEEVYKSSGLIQLKGILEYCGISFFQSNFIGPIDELGEDYLKKCMEHIKELATEDVINELM